MELRTRYQLISQLPLFQGISGKELALIEATMGIHMEELPPMKHPVIRQGDHCTHLFFLAKGTLRRNFISEDGLYSATSYISAPAVLEPECLYGLRCRFHYAYIPETDIVIINTSKLHIVKQLMKIEIFRINYLNLLSAIIEKQGRLVQPLTLLTAREKLIHCIRTIFPECKGPALLNIKMKDLAGYISETRLTTSQILNQLEQEGLLELRRSCIHIFDTPTLIQEPT